MGLDYKYSAIDLWRSPHALTREIAIKRSRNVNSVAILEQSKLCADTRVEVEELVLTVSFIETIVDVHYTCVGNRFDESLGLLEERGVGDRSAQCCRTESGRIRAQLSASEAGQARRV